MHKNLFEIIAISFHNWTCRRMWHIYKILHLLYNHRARYASEFNASDIIGKKPDRVLQRKEKLSLNEQIKKLYDLLFLREKKAYVKKEERRKVLRKT